MAFGLKITVDTTTRVESCDRSICLKENIRLLGEKGVAAGMLGVGINDIKEVKQVGSCKNCEFNTFIRNRESQ